MRFPLEIILGVNAILIFLAIVGVLVLARGSLKYRRSVGDIEGEHKWRSVILKAAVFLFFLSVAAAAFNLFSI